LADKTEGISGMTAKNNQMIIFTTEDKKVSVNVRLDEETVWLTLDQMAELFDRDKSTISRHIKNVFDEGELAREATVANFATVQKEGGREVTRRIEFFNQRAQPVPASYGHIRHGHRLRPESRHDTRVLCHRSK
jgi:predicted transcriptional regulator